MESIGLLDNKYTMLKKKGSGATSLVYKVKDINEKSQKIYGAKILKHLENNKSFRLSKKSSDEIFENEIKFLNILKNKNSPYIINLYESGTGEVKRLNKPTSLHKYIILDYASKGNFFDYIFYPEQSLKEDYCRLIFYKIFKGIKVCHDSNICNRDIKLQNILFDKNYNPKICDFGFADFNSNKLTEKVGTQTYLDPKVLKKGGYNGFKTDIFNLGLALLIVITGRFFINTLIDVNMKKLYDKEKNKEFWEKIKIEGLSDQIKNLLNRMLTYEQEERPTIEQVLNDDWFKIIEKSSQKEIEDLEDKIKEELGKRKDLIKDRKELEMSINGYNDSLTLNNNRGGENDILNIFNSDIKPKYIKKESGLNNNYIKIKGNLNYAQFMNAFLSSIIEKFGKNVLIKENIFKMKFEIFFEEDDEDILENFKLLEKEINKSYNNNDDNKEEKNEDEENEEDENNIIINKPKLIIQVKLFKTLNGEYLLRFIRLSGELYEYYKNLEIIISLAKNLLIDF